MLAILLSSLASAATLPQLVTVTVEPTAPEFAMGTPAWLRVRVENHSKHPVSAWTSHPESNIRSGIRAYALDAAGARVPDPDKWPPPALGGGRNVGGQVPPGGSVEVELDLNRYAWLDTPGTYTVRLLHPLGPRGPEGDADPRWVETSVVIREPTEAEVLEAIAALGQRDDVPAYLGHARFVPLLVNVVRGAFPDDRVRARAAEALGTCPCPEAMDALLWMLDGCWGRLCGQLAEEVRASTPDPRLFNAWANSETPPHYAERMRWFTERAVPEHLEPALRASAERRARWYGPHEEYWAEWGQDMVRRLDAMAASREVGATTDP